jgi:hypothetical protein
MTLSDIPVVERSHDAYAAPLDGGYKGYQARCWDCDWTGTEFLRGDEPMGTEASRQHKRKAQVEAAEHSEANTVPACSKCGRAVNPEDE